MSADHVISVLRDNQDAPYGIHEGECAGTTCPGCGCCVHCIDCSCRGCSDHDCGCWLVYGEAP